MMKKTLLLISILLVFSICQADQPSSPASVEQECQNEFTKVTPCLSYGTGKTASPSAECCSAVSDIKSRNPVCLCFIIQQTHEGQASLKQLGVQEDKLLHLPTACKLTNASISDCPKLLKLSSSSPDAAIFTNSSSSATSISTGAVSPPSSSDNTKSNNGFKHRVHVTGPTGIIVAAVAVFMISSEFTAGLDLLDGVVRRSMKP